MMLLEFREVLGHSIMHRPLKISPQHFNQLEVWTLEYCSTFVLFLFSLSVEELLMGLGIIVLLHDPLSAKRQL